jgi:Lysine methyltransferase
MSNGGCISRTDSNSNRNSNRKTRVGKDSKAQLRWKLLRQAITQQSVSRSDAQFKGFGLLPASESIELTDDEMKSIQKKLTIVPVYCTNATEFMEVSLLSLLTIDPSCTSITFNVPSALLASACLESTALHLKQACSLNECNIHSNDTFKLKRFTVSDTLKLLVRERVSVQVSLAELTSHVHTVDNTGNICIWDCELVLTWALQQWVSLLSLQPRGLVVAELGVGMAGLAALSMNPYSNAVYLTDGHVGSVQNNRINLQMMECMGVLPSTCTFYTTLLPWSYNVTKDFIQADLTLVSDCTHFEHYHGELLWTLVACTKVDGTIWMCHPDRGNSLNRFLQLVEAVNSTGEQLVEVTEHKFPSIDEKHEMLLKIDSAYNANIHYPRIFTLHKLRSQTEQDKATIITHIRGRNCL